MNSVCQEPPQTNFEKAPTGAIHENYGCLYTIHISAISGIDLVHISLKLISDANVAPDNTRGAHKTVRTILEAIEVAREACAAIGANGPEVVVGDWVSACSLEPMGLSYGEA